MFYPTNPRRNHTNCLVLANHTNSKLGLENPPRSGGGDRFLSFTKKSNYNSDPCSILRVLSDLTLANGDGGETGDRFHNKSGEKVFRVGL